eukprot:3988938-Prymnesium_polylepis.1
MPCARARHRRLYEQGESGRGACEIFVWDAKVDRYMYCACATHAPGLPGTATGQSLGFADRAPPAVRQS